MTDDRSTELIRQAVIHHGHRCSICGRPCGEDEARRHSLPDAGGDSAINFAAMCHACQARLAEAGMTPAQPVTHRHEASRTGELFRDIISYAEVTLAIITVVALVIAIGATVYLMPGIVWIPLGTCLLIYMMIVHGMRPIAGLVADVLVSGSYRRSTQQELDRAPMRREQAS